MDGMVKVPKRKTSGVREGLENEKADFDPWVPPGFFDDTYLLPSFYMPENKELLVNTHNSIRRTLFGQVFK